jgi:DNA-directed RNA polymerase specialized sigma24 family protein
MMTVAPPNHGTSVPDTEAVHELFQFVSMVSPFDRAFSDRLLVDPWFQRMSMKNAVSLLLRHHLPVGWNDDLVQQAMLTLKQDFHAAVDPKLDLTSVGRFTVSLRRLAFRHCRRALRRLLVEFEHPSLRTDPWVEDGPSACDVVLDLRAAIDLLSEPQRTVLRMRCHGRSVE